MKFRAINIIKYEKSLSKGLTFLKKYDIIDKLFFVRGISIYVNESKNS